MTEQCASHYAETNKENTIATNGPSKKRGGRRPGGGGRPGGNRSGGFRGRPNETQGPRMSLDGKYVEIEGTISQVLAGTMFKVKLANEREVHAHISGKMRKRFIRLVAGDRVKMEMSPYDTSKARIVFRLR